MGVEAMDLPMEDLIPARRWMPTTTGSKSLFLHDHIGCSVAGASKTSKSRIETPGQSALKPTIWSAKCLKVYFNGYFTTVAPALFVQYNITADSAGQAKKRACMNGPTHANGNNLEAEELITVEATMQICPPSL